MQPNPRNATPPAGRPRAWHNVAASNPRHHSTPPRRRCPWHADLVRLAASPVQPYQAWRDCAVLFAGTHAWEAAAPTRERGARAVTVLPPGADPHSIMWPPVRWWVCDVGDVATDQALELARCLIDAGAQSVQAIGRNLIPSLCVRRAGA